MLAEARTGRVPHMGDICIKRYGQAHLPGGDFRVCGGLEEARAMGLLYGFLA
jgi:hypothetical protein